MNRTIVISDWTTPVISACLRSGPVANAARTSASSAIELVDVGRQAPPAAEPLDGRLEQARDAREVERAVEEPGDGDLVGGDQRRRRARARRGPPRGRCAAPGSAPRRARGSRAGRSAMRSGGGGRRRAAVGIGQGVLDGKSHVGGAQLGLEGAVDEPDGRVDDALRMDDHLDRVVADIVQPVRLDDLQALVRERRRVDRDLGAHRPGRVAERLLRGDRGELAPASRRGTGRPTRSGSGASTVAIDSPTRHCQIAECSESIGRSQASGLA